MTGPEDLVRKIRCIGLALGRAHIGHVQKSQPHHPSWEDCAHEPMFAFSSFTFSQHTARTWIPFDLSITIVSVHCCGIVQAGGELLGAATLTENNGYRNLPVCKEPRYAERNPSTSFTLYDISYSALIAERVFSIPELTLLVLKLAPPRTWPTLCLLNWNCAGIVQPYIWKSVACHTLTTVKKIQPHIRQHVHHAESLNLDSLPQPTLSAILQELSSFVCLPNIASLVLCNSKITLNQLSALLAKLPHLKEVDIRGCVLHKHALEVLAQCINLESMAFFHENVFLSQGYNMDTAFAPWTRLRRLSITVPPNADLSAYQFEEAINRSQLDMEWLELSTPHWKTNTIERIIMRNSKLKRLVLRNCGLAGKGWMVVLPSLTNLEYIAAHDSMGFMFLRTFEKHLRVIQSSPSIQHIVLGGYRIQDHEFKTLAETATALNSLTLTHCTISSQGLRHIIDHCVKLDRLRVQVFHTIGGFKGLFKDGPWPCSELQELELIDISWSQADMASQETMKESLETMWKSLNNLSRLRVLTLRQVNMSRPTTLYLQCFGAHTNLQQLCLTGHGSWTYQELFWIAENFPGLEEFRCNDMEMDTSLWAWMQKNRPDVQLFPAKPVDWE